MIAQYIANGLLIGSLYACLAVGFSLIYGVLNIINVMHGSFVVLGAYVTIYCSQLLGLSPLDFGHDRMRRAVRLRLSRPALT